MNVTVDEIIVWLIVGALAGSLTGAIVMRKREGFGRYINLGIGLVGALIGGLIFNFFEIDLGLRDLAITFEDLISAFAGSLIFLIIVWLIRRSFRRKKS
jgi:uncharacterized membrane protein YeaQ/YmgE (transglycosylase-associated protein family)